MGKAGNRFFRTDGEPGELPNRLYGRIERAEPSAAEPNEPVTIFFDCVSADWIDRAPEQLDLDNAPLSVVSLRVARSSMLPLGDGIAEGPAWYQLSIRDQRTPLPIRHHETLFDAGAGRFLEKVSPAPPRISFILDRHASMDDFPDATQRGIENAIGERPIDAAAVYDVGQGNCNALLSGGAPALYFDFGGGVLNNTHTFPVALRRFCLSRDPTIVLSHLDWDHWSSAQRFPQALECRWIVPRQDTSGLIHKAFLANLRDNGTLLVFPSTLPSARNRQVLIERCSGHGRNHSGLALTVFDYSSKDAMLFPADARYSCVPSAKSYDYAVVVAPHHGGNPRNSFVPRRTGRDDDRVVFSYGANNSYRHPSEAAEVLHRDWPVWLDTAMRVRPPGRRDDIPAHIGLCWNRQAPHALALPCGGTRCDLEPSNF